MDKTESFLQMDKLGILKVNKIPPHLDWLTENQKQVLIYTYLNGEDGLHSSQLKSILKAEPDCIMFLEIKKMITWITDNCGKPKYVQLTWQGDLVAKLLLIIAKNVSQGTVHG